MIGLVQGGRIFTTAKTKAESSGGGGGAEGIAIPRRRSRTSGERNSRGGVIIGHMTRTSDSPKLSLSGFMTEERGAMGAI
jgi:hypothetical protein